MLKEIDARGLSCPQPVLETKKALEEMETGTLKVIVDNPVSYINVTRFAKSMGCQVETDEKDDEFHITITKS